MSPFPRELRNLIDNHTMNAIQIAANVHLHQDYLRWRETFSSKLGGENGEVDILCAMAFAMTAAEAAVDKDVAFWESEDLRCDWRECCEAFADFLISFSFANWRPPTTAELQSALSNIITQPNESTPQ